MGVSLSLYWSERRVSEIDFAFALVRASPTAQVRSGREIRGQITRLLLTLHRQYKGVVWWAGRAGRSESVENLAKGQSLASGAATRGLPC